MKLNKSTSARYGHMLYKAHDKIIGKALEHYGEWAQDELNLLQNFIKPGDTVVDIGANIGTHTLAFAAFTGPSGKVLAFEPQRLIFQCLAANVANNDLENVFTYPYGVGAEAGLMHVPEVDYNSEENFGSISLVEENVGEPVPIVALDDLCDSCNLLKIDVEGMEIAVLQGATELIKNCRPVLYTENNNNEKSPALINYIRNLGYHVYWHLSPFYNAGNFKGNAKNIFGNILDINILCSALPINGTSNCFFAATDELNTPEKAFQRFVGGV